MKHSSICKRLLALCIVLTLVLGLSGCNFHINSIQNSLSRGDDEVNEAMHTLLDAIAAGDEEAALALLHPKLNPKLEDFRVFLQALPDYMPLPETYELTSNSLKYNTNINTQGKVKTVSGVYKIEFDGQTFYAVYSYLSNSAGTGFEQLRFFNEADFALFQGIG